MNAERTAIARKAFAYVLLKTAVSSKPEHFYPLTAEGKFPHYMPEQIFQAFAEVDERVRREEERGHVCRFVFADREVEIRELPLPGGRVKKFPGSWLSIYRFSIYRCKCGAEHARFDHRGLR